MIKSKVGNPSGLRFEEGSKSCGICGCKDDIIQFERETKRKGLPIVEIAFLCKSCAKEEGLIDDSTVIPENNRNK